MIQLRTVLNVADNSGARKLLCIQVKGGSFRKVGTIGVRLIVNLPFYYYRRLSWIG